MAKNWYPVIDYTLCVECGNCTDKCKLMGNGASWR